MLTQITTISKKLRRQLRCSIWEIENVRYWYIIFPGTNQLSSPHPSTSYYTSQQTSNPTSQQTTIIHQTTPIPPLSISKIISAITSPLPKTSSISTSVANSTATTISSVTGVYDITTYSATDQQVSPSSTGSGAIPTASISTTQSTKYVSSSDYTSISSSSTKSTTTATTMPPLPVECSGIARHLKSPFGHVVSPGYDNGIPYPNGITCTWLIGGVNGKVWIFMKFQKLQCMF